MLSDFSNFHFALNNWYLPLDEADGEKYDSEYKALGFNYGDDKNFKIQTDEMNAIRKRIVDSWDRIFDLDREDDNYAYGYNSEKSIQATFWELRLDQVIKAEVYPIKLR